MTDLRQRLAEAMHEAFVASLDSRQEVFAALSDAAHAATADWLREHALIRDTIVAYEWTDPRTGEKRLLDPAEVTVVVRP